MKLIIKNIILKKLIVQIIILQEVNFLMRYFNIIFNMVIILKGLFTQARKTRDVKNTHNL